MALLLLRTVGDGVPWFAAEVAHILARFSMVAVSGMPARATELTFLDFFASFSGDRSVLLSAFRLCHFWFLGSLSSTPDVRIRRIGSRGHEGVGGSCHVSDASAKGAETSECEWSGVEWSAVE